VAFKYLGPMIEDRRRNVGVEGCKKPVVILREFISDDKVDLLQWLMDTAKGEETRTDRLIARLLAVNFASIHTASLVCPCTYVNLITDFHTCAIHTRSKYRIHRPVTRGNRTTGKTIRLAKRIFDENAKTRFIH